MADNVPVTPGVGKDIATDDIGGVHHQRVKITVGANGVNDGDVSSANPLPVSGAVTVASLPLPSGAATSAKQDTAAALLTTIDASLNDIETAIEGTLTVGLPSGASTSAKQDTGNTSLASIDGKLPAALVSGRLDVNIGAASGTVTVTGTVTASEGLTDNGGGFSDGTSKVVPPGFLYDEVAGTALTENDIAAARINANRAQVHALEDGSTRGRYATVTASNALKVDGSAVTQPVSAASLPLPTGAATETTLAALAPGLTDNAGFTDGTSKVVPAGFIYDEVAGTALTENDVAAARINVNRAMVGAIEDGTTRGRYATVTASNAVKVDGSAVTQPVSIAASVTVAQATASNLNAQVVGAAAHDAAVAGNPVLIAGRASAAAPTSVDADGDAVRAWMLRNGAQATVVTAAGALIGGDAANGLDVDVTRVTGTVTTSAAGDVAHDAGDSGNPVKIGYKARNALPTAVANGDRADGSSDLWGRLLTASIDPAMQVWKSFNATTQQTGATIWDPTSGKKIAITHIQIGTYGTTAGRLILWFGDNADTTYTAGTDQLVFAGSFAPSSTAKPGAVVPLPHTIFCTTADRELHITTDAALSVDVTVYGFEF